MECERCTLELDEAPDESIHRKARCRLADDVPSEEGLLRIIGNLFKRSVEVRLKGRLSVAIAGLAQTSVSTPMLGGVAIAEDTALEGDIMFGETGSSL